MRLHHRDPTCLEKGTRFVRPLYLNGLRATMEHSEINARIKPRRFIRLSSLTVLGISNRRSDPINDNEYPNDRIAIRIVRKI